MMISNMAFTSSVSFIITQVVRDKETKMRETLKIMSLSRSAYMWSYFIVQSFFVAATSVILTVAFIIPIKIKSEEEIPYLRVIYDAPFQLMITIFLFGLALVSMSLAFSTLFHDSKIAGQIGTFIVFLPDSFFILALVHGISIIIREYSLREDTNILPQASHFKWI